MHIVQEDALSGIMSRLDALGSKGWEMIIVSPGDGEMVLWFKRRVT